MSALLTRFADRLTLALVEPRVARAAADSCVPDCTNEGSCQNGVFLTRQCCVMPNCGVVCSPWVNSGTC